MLVASIELDRGEVRGWARFPPIAVTKKRGASGGDLIGDLP
jgi:hypothetical protein